MAEQLTGVIAAVPTPLDSDFRPDHARFVRHARWALENGCDALNVLGSTGEATSLAPGARMALMRHAADHLPGARMMVGTGAPDLETAIALTRAAGEFGFAAALVLPPYYYAAVTDAGLFAFFDALVQATQDIGVPLYLYNFPQMTGISLSVELAMRLKEAHPQRVRGAKDSSGDLENSAALARIADFDVFPSDETSIAEAAGRGFAGTISATVNVSAPIAARLWADPADTDLLAQVGHVRRTISAQPLIPAVKHMVALRQDDPAWEAVMPPFLPLGCEGRAALAPLWDELREI